MAKKEKKIQKSNLAENDRTESKAIEAREENESGSIPVQNDTIGEAKYPIPELTQTFSKDRWIYSEIDPPIVLKAGNQMPAGYQVSAKFDKIVWECNDYGKFTRRSK